MTDATFLAPEVVKINHYILQKLMKTKQLEFPCYVSVLSATGWNQASELLSSRILHSKVQNLRVKFKKQYDPRSNSGNPIKTCLRMISVVYYWNSSIVKSKIIHFIFSYLLLDAKENIGWYLQSKCWWYISCSRGLSILFFCYRSPIDFIEKGLNCLNVLETAAWRRKLVSLNMKLTRRIEPTFINVTSRLRPPELWLSSSK